MGWIEGFVLLGHVYDWWDRVRGRPVSRERALLRDAYHEGRRVLRRVRLSDGSESSVRDVSGVVLAWSGGFQNRLADVRPDLAELVRKLSPGIVEPVTRESVRAAVERDLRAIKFAAREVAWPVWMVRLSRRRM